MKQTTSAYTKPYPKAAPLSTSASISTSSSVPKSTSVSVSVSASPKHKALQETLFTLEVTLVDGPMRDSFRVHNPKIMRTLLMPEHSTLAELHQAIFAAFDRSEQAMYEFQTGGLRLMDIRAKQYVLSAAKDDHYGLVKGMVELTKLSELGLKPGNVFLYWFDFEHDWIHHIKLAAVSQVDKGEYPQITLRIGDSPPDPSSSEWQEML